MKMQIAVFTAAGLELAEWIEKLCKPNTFDEIVLHDFRLGGKGNRQTGEGFPLCRTDSHSVVSEENTAQGLISGGERMSLREWTEKAFLEKNALLFIGACGIAVRSIAPFVKSKVTDPPVLVMDEKGQFVIPLLSSHIGGAGALARELAALTGGTAVITTASDVNNVFAVDVFAKENGLFIKDMQKAKEITAAAVAGKTIGIYYSEKDKKTEEALEKMELAGQKGLHKIPYVGLWPKELEKGKGLEGQSGAPVVVISPAVPVCGMSPDKRRDDSGLFLQLVPQSIVLGMGCRKGKEGEKLLLFIKETLGELGIWPEAVSCIASIDLKEKEAGLLYAAKELEVPFEVFSVQKLKEQPGTFSSSAFVQEKMGVDNICERAAMAAGARILLKMKESREGMTLAVGSKYPVKPEI